MEAMRYVKSEKYNTPALQAKIMGPNPIKLEEELLLSWTPEQLDYMHDVDYWRGIVSQCRGAEVLSMREMESNDEVWADWLAQDNEYAVGDRKSMEAGGGKYLNFIAIVLAIIGTLDPVVGALVHNAGSVLVITNSAFLLNWKKKS